MKTLVLMMLFVISVPAFGLTSPDLQGVISRAKSTDMIPVDIVLKEQMDVRVLTDAVKDLPKPQRRAMVAQILTAFSEEHQRDVMAYLRAMEKQGKVTDIKSFWLSNAMYCRATIEVIEALDQNARVYYVDYDYKHIELEKPVRIPVPPDKTREIAWGVNKINAPAVWALGYTGQGVIVGEIDTGVNYNHVDLASHMWTDANYPNHGWDFELNNNNPMDDYGHGTHVAGSVASDGTAGSQCGVAPDAMIMALKVWEYADTVGENNIWAAMQFAVSPPLSPTNGADLITMSMGYTYDWNPRRSIWRTNCNSVGAAGIVMCVAAGNERGYTPPNACRCPGDVPSPWRHPQNGATGAQSDVISVGATDVNDAIGYFSSPGPVTWQSIAPFNDYTYPPGLTKPDVSAPGVNIKSCDWQNINGYLDGWDGTSMATPHTAGTVALMLQKNPNLTTIQIDSILQMTAVDLGTTGKDNDFGAGRINALAAVNATPYPYALMPLAYSIDDPGPGGNNNGQWESGEQVNLIVPICNQTPNPVTNASANLSETDPYVTIIDGSVTLGNIAAYDTVDAVFIVSADASTPLMHIVNFTMALSHDGGDQDFPLDVYINPLPTLTYQDNTVVGGNGNGILDPNETADIIVTLKNEGPIDAQSVTSILTESSPYITINDALGNFGNIAVDDTANNAADPYTVTASASTPTGTVVDFSIQVTSGVYVDTLAFSLTVGRKHYYVWNPDPTPAPGQNMHALLGGLGYSGDYGTSLASDLSLYQAVLVCVGIYSSNYIIDASSAEATALVDFLQNHGGRMYLEGGDVWYYDPPYQGGYDFGPLFGISASSDGSSDLGPIAGQTGTFTVGMSFNYGGENNWIDHIDPTGTGFLIFHDTDNAYNCGVANAPTGYRTVGTSFELGLLTDGSGVSTRAVLLDSIMRFFGCVVTGVAETEGLAATGVLFGLNVYPSISRNGVRISYGVGRNAKDVALHIYDASGRVVKSFSRLTLDALRITQIIWDGTDDLQRSVPAGVYFVKLEAGDRQAVQKAVLLR